MKKAVVLVFVLLFIVISINSEVVILKNGNVINGDIISQNETKMKIRTSYGEVIVIKEEIKKVYFDEDEYNEAELEEEEDRIRERIDEDKWDEEEEKEDEEEEDDNERLSEDEDSKEQRKRIFSHYKAIKNLGFGLLIPGLVLSIAPTVFATPPIVVYFLKNSHPFDNEFFCVGFGWYAVAITAGLMLDIGAIICLAAAGRMHKKWLKKYAVTFAVGFENNGPSFGMKLKM